MWVGGSDTNIMDFCQWLKQVHPKLQDFLAVWSSLDLHSSGHTGMIQESKIVPNLLTQFFSLSVNQKFLFVNKEDRILHNAHHIDPLFIDFKLRAFHCT